MIHSIDQGAISGASDDQAPRAGETVRFYLRRQTADLHEKLDSSVPLESLVSETGYAEFLCRHLRALGPLEAALVASGAAAEFPDWPKRTRVEALRSDLAALNRPVPERFDSAAVGPLSRAEMFGVLYVLEGSRFGNASLKKLLSENRPDFPLSFVSHGEDEGLWKPFVSELNSLAEVAGDVLQGSRKAFRFYLAIWSAGHVNV